MEKNGFLPVGKIVGAHGIKGNLKVFSYAESLSVFNPGNSILISRTGKIEKKYTIKWAKPHGKRILLSLKDIENRRMAETLVGAKLFIERGDLPKLEEGAYYWCDIIGLSVFTTEGQYVGCIESIIATGSNDVFVVMNPDNDHETLIPGLESVILEIDFEHKRMVVNLPEGL